MCPTAYILIIVYKGIKLHVLLNTAILLNPKDLNKGNFSFACKNNNLAILFEKTFGSG
jgi:hypothetical protein